VKAPIFVARQLVKHKFLRWNEISRRYVDDEPEFYTPEVWRGRSEDKKQGSSGVSVWNHGKGSGYREEEYEVMLEVKCLYSKMIANGVAPEQARMVLPQSTMTEWYWSGSLDAFADMCKLRCKEDTQYETRLVADQISEKMKQLFPVSWLCLLERKE
jgi:thymidylate synthase (FAD)